MGPFYGASRNLGHLGLVMLNPLMDIIFSLFEPDLPDLLSANSSACFVIKRTRAVNSLKCGFYNRFYEFIVAHLEF